MIGNEVGPRPRTLVGIAAGFLDGVGMSSLKGALMSRGTREVARLIKAMGGNELSAYGCAIWGTTRPRCSRPTAITDSSASPSSAIRTTTGWRRALHSGGTDGAPRKYGVELPICMAVHNILYESADPGQS